ncbi:DUF3558 domain-containing protein [Amycolatopsis antarctica]|uniref:DUF3558 domain-containing protein n=1 Tax=Amycolatopsis antarctica TaxID=1854586 RepID=UPI0013FD9794|nr:DUF3558 domain-containing protein [Amycolatopsis antarctica]
MSNRARAARFRRVTGAALAGLALLGTLAGCAGEDLTKANFQRTTVPPDPGSGGSGPVPSGPITDEAVTADRLRTVDPCPLLSDEAVGSLGTPDERKPSGFGRCSTTIRDAGGKTLDVTIEVGQYLLGTADDANGSVEGLPQIEKKQDESTCYVTALTSKDPALGVQIAVDYSGAGEPCRPGRTVLQQVVKDLRDGPAQIPAAQGSLVPVDPCTAVDDEVIAGLVPPEVEQQPTSLRGCQWRSRGTSVAVDFRTGYPPRPGDDGQPVDLGNGISGLSEQLGDSNECKITWLHRTAGEEGEDELVNVSWSNYNGEATADDPCAKVLTAAQAAAGTLPRP